jgi:oligosaccharide repeat unit polymerase
MLAISFLIISVAIMFAQYYADGRKFDIFNPKTLFQIYFIIQLPLVLLIGISSDASGFSRLSLATSDNEVLALGGIIMCAQITLIASYYTTGNKWLSFPVIGTKKWRIQRVKYICILVFGAGYIAFLYLLNINGGYFEFISNREAWRAGGMSGQGWLIFPATSMIAMASIAYLIAFAAYFRGKFGALRLAFLIVITILPASQLGFRGLMLLPVIQIMFIYHYRVCQIKMRRAIPLLAVLALIFTLYGVYREASSYTGGDVDINAVSQVVSAQPDLLYSIFLRSKGADIVASVVNQLEKSGYYRMFFPGIIETLTIPIPSALWISKPVPQSVQFSELFFGIGGGVSPTVVGEAYWNGGVAGVLIAMTLIGCVFRLYQNSVRRAGNKDSTIFIAASIFPSLVMMAEAIQGYVNAIFLQLIFASILIFIFSARLHTSDTAGKSLKGYSH